MTDFRALCSELLDEAIYLGQLPYEQDPGSELVNRARAALAQPEPEGPTVMEVIAFWSEHCAGDGDAGILRLARYGRPAVEPVPVSERLPGPEDCDAQGRCWWAANDGIYDHWRKLDLDKALNNPWRPTHWLPHHALPTPNQEAGQ